MPGSTAAARRTPLATAALCAALLCAAPAGAELYFGGAGGAFVPYEGDTGWTVLAEFGSDWTSDHVRVGGEAIFTSLDTTVDATALGGSRFELAIRTYELRFVTRYVLFPGRVTPYVGVGAGVVLIDTDDAPAAAAGSLAALALSLGGISVAGGLDGHVGLELPLFSKEVNLFAEGRAEYNWDFAGDLPRSLRENATDGFSGIAGLRARY